MESWEASAYDVGLRGIILLRQHFPEFYHQHAAGLKAGLPRLLGVCCAFWRLLEQRGLELVWPWDTCDLKRSCPDDPVEALMVWDGVDCEWMSSSLGYHLWQPRLIYHGIGVQLLLDSSIDDLGALDYLLWHLFRRTGHSLGLELDDTPDMSCLTEEVARRILRLKPLPDGVTIACLAPYLAIPSAVAHEVPPSEVLAYAFGCTSNTLANHSNEEIEEVYGGEFDEWGWDSVPQLIALSAGARRIRDAYDAWSEQVDSDPAREIPKVAGMLHKAARAARTQVRVTTLVELVGSLPENTPLPSTIEVL